MINSGNSNVNSNNVSYNQSPIKKPINPTPEKLERTPSFLMRIALTKKKTIIRPNTKEDESNNITNVIENKDHYNLNIKFEEKVKKLNEELEIKKMENDKKIDKINKTIQTLDNEIKFIKNNLYILYSKQRDYYYEILIRGSDVRSIGLTWIIKRLVELNSNIDHSIFPRFLDNHEIDFILSIAYKSVEISQLKLFMKTLKFRHKQKNNQNELILNRNNHGNLGKENSTISLKKDSLCFNDNKKIDESRLKIENKFSSSSGFVNIISSKISNKRNKSNTFGTHDELDKNLINSCEIFLNPNMSGHKSDFYLKSFSKKALRIFENIFQKYEIMGKNKFEHEKEDKNVNLKTLILNL